MSTVSTESDLRAAVSNATAGSVITVADGTYDLQDQLATQAGGTASNPIIIRAQNPHGAIIDTNGQQAAFLVTHPYWVIEDLKIVVASNSTYGIKAEANGQYLTIRGNEIQLEPGSEAGVKGAGGAMAPQPDYALIENNEIHFSAPTTYFLAEGVDAVAVAGWVLRRNVVHGIQTSAASVAYGLMTKGNSQNTIMEDNLIYDCFIGLSFGGGGTGSQWMRDGDPTYEHRDGIIRNNIVMSSTDVALYLYSANNATVHNNTFFDSYISCGGGCSSIDVRMPGSTADIRNNIIDKSINDRDGGAHSEASNAYLPSPSATTWFVDAASRDMRLVSGSPAVDTGQALLTTVPDDFSGTARPLGNAYDVGAFEYLAALPPPLDAGIADSGVIPPVPDAGRADDAGVTSEPIDAGITSEPVDAGVTSEPIDAGVGGSQIATEPPLAAPVATIAPSISGTPIATPIATPIGTPTEAETSPAHAEDKLRGSTGGGCTCVTGSAAQDASTTLLLPLLMLVAYAFARARRLLALHSPNRSPRTARAPCSRLATNDRR